MEIINLRFNIVDYWLKKMLMQTTRLLFKFVVLLLAI